MDCSSNEGVGSEQREEVPDGVGSISGRLGEVSEAVGGVDSSPGSRNDGGEGVSFESHDEGNMQLQSSGTVDPMPLDELLPENLMMEVSSSDQGDRMEPSVKPLKVSSANNLSEPVAVKEEESVDGSGGTKSSLDWQSKNAGGEGMLWDEGVTVRQSVRGERNVEVAASNNYVKENVSSKGDGKRERLMEEGAGREQVSSASNFGQDFLLGESGEDMDEKLQSIKCEVDVENERRLSDQHQEVTVLELKRRTGMVDIVETSVETGIMENYNQKNLAPPGIVKKVDQEFHSENKENVTYRASSEMSKAMEHKYFSGNKRGRDYDEQEEMVNDRPLNHHSFQPGDMVWGKVKSHPWWPGHVFCETFASAPVRRTKREGYLLVAFFGDSSYGWFDPDELVPFEPHFAEKSKQTSSRNFMRAVEEAVDEACRRCALGLACCCRNPNMFRPSHVEGYFAVDVVDYEAGGVYSERQIKEARDNFKPVECLSFVQQLALTPRSTDHQSLGSIKSIATVLSYRRAVFIEFDETYAQAFGVDPVRPSQVSVDSRYEPVRVARAPLSGPLVIAEALTHKSRSLKPAKTKISKKDKYLFKRRDEPNNKKLLFEEESVSQHSEEEMQNSHSSGVENFIFQQRLPSLKEKQRTFLPKSDQKKQLALEEPVIETKPGVSVAGVDQATTGVPDKAMAGAEQPPSVGTSDGWKVDSVGGMKATAKKKKLLHAEKIPSSIKLKHKLSEKKHSTESPVSLGDVNSRESKTIKKHKVSGILKTSVKKQRLAELPKRSAAGSDIPFSDARYQLEGQAELVQIVDVQASGRSGISTQPNSFETEQSGAVLGSLGFAEMEKANSLKRLLTENSKDSGSGSVCGVAGDIKKKKKKKKPKPLETEQNHLQKHAEFHRSSISPEKAAKLNSGLLENSLMPQDLHGNDENAGRDGLSVKSSASFKAETGYTEQLSLRQLVNDLLFLALDPFHGIDRNAPANSRLVFLRFRSIVYLKETPGSAEAPDRSDRHATGKAMPDSGVADVSISGEEGMVGRNQSSSLKTQANKVDDIKPPRKRSVEQSDDVPAKKFKKSLDPKAAASDRKPVQKVPEGPQGEKKDASAAMPVKSSKQDPGRKPPAPAPRVSEPTAVNLKFPLGSSLPSEAQLKARFARFGPLDLTGTRVYYRSATCRVVFKYKSDARAAYDHVTKSGIFGQGVRYSLKEMNSSKNESGTSSEIDAGRRRSDDGGGNGLDDIAPSRSGGEALGERRLLPSLAQRQTPLTQLKSCLKKPASEDAGSNIGVVKESPRVKFMLGGEENGRGDQSINGTSSADGAPVVALDLNNNSKMVHVPPLFPTPSLPLPRETPQNPLLLNQVAEIKSPVDISHQLLSLLLKCNDIVSNVKCTLGYVPYHPL
ncbi:PWWP domain-containing protein 1-like [Nymphaea colorata]|nr:PWWP domain-containing protein 1-like [Nymphaea colorata]